MNGMENKKLPSEVHTRSAQELDDSTDPPVPLPIDGVLDLHTFRPRDVKNLLKDYIDACLESSVFDIRIIHGKGVGVMRDIVYSILSRHPAVESFQQAPLEAGGWGAVVVRLRKPLHFGQSSAE